MAEKSSNGLFSAFAGNKRIPKDSYGAYMKTAMFIDLALFWLPAAGTVFIGFCRGMWWLNRYYTDKMLASTLISAAAELFPVVPGSCAFVWFSYRINKANTEPLEGEEDEGQSKTEGAEDLALKSLQKKTAGKNQNAAETQPGSQEQQVADDAGKKTPRGDQSGRSGGSEMPRQQSTLKDTPNQNAAPKDSSVDGIKPAPKETGRNEAPAKSAYQPRQPLFRQQAANENAAPAEEMPAPEVEPQGEDGEEFFDNSRLAA